MNKTIFDGAIRKCPNCGATISSISCVCDACGYEFSERESIKSIREFSNLYNSTSSNQKKIDLIRTFPIPNSKEDIVEFALLAGRNYDSELSKENHQNNGDSTNQEVGAAWLSQLETTYQKAAVLFNNSREFAFVEKLYKEKVDQQKKNERKRIFNSILKHWKAILIAVGVIAITLMIVIPLSNGTFRKASADKAFNSQISKIENSIKKKDYDLALTQIYALETNGSEEKEEIKRKLLNQINDLKDQERMIQIPISSFKGKNYEEIVKLFEEAGFTNVKTEKVKKGWFDKEGAVKEVSINGITKFNDTASFKRNSEIIIKYYVKS